MKETAMAEHSVVLEIYKNAELGIVLPSSAFRAGQLSGTQSNHVNNIGGDAYAAMFHSRGVVLANSRLIFSFSSTAGSGYLHQCGFRLHSESSLQ